MGVQMKQTARIHHRKATSFFFLSGPGIVSLASSLILVNKPTGLNRKKKHPQGHNDFSTWLYTLFQLGKEFLHINNLIPCLKSTEPWCTNITRMWDTSMWSVNTGVQLHRKSVNFIIKVGKMRMDIFFNMIHLLWVMLDVVYPILAKGDGTTLIILLKLWHKWANRIW